jgi:uncharacterized membrane protein YhfC
MVGGPIALAVLLTRRFRLPWSLVAAGAVAFVGSQVVHIPLNFAVDALAKPHPPPHAWRLPTTAAILGTTAGVCEELARYVVLRFWRKEARTFRHALVLGAGHGGIESVLLGLLAALTFASMLMLRAHSPSELGVPPDAAEAVTKQVHEYWSMRLYDPLLAAAERVSAVTFHLSASALVVRALVSRRVGYLGAAVAWHAVTDAAAVYLAGRWGARFAELEIVPVILVSAVILYGLRRTGDAG